MTPPKKIVAELDPEDIGYRVQRIEFLLSESGITEFKQNLWKLHALIQEQKDLYDDLLGQVNILTHEALQDRKEIEGLRMLVKALNWIFENK